MENTQITDKIKAGKFFKIHKLSKLKLAALKLCLEKWEYQEQGFFGY